MLLNGDTVTSNSPSSLHAGGHEVTEFSPHASVIMFCLTIVSKAKELTSHGLTPLEL